MNSRKIGLLLLLISLALLVPGKARAIRLPATPFPGYGQDHDDWDRPPDEFREIQRKGFHDGVEGARKDFDNHRQPNVDNRSEFRHPHVPPSDRDDYREGFRRGYESAVAHLYGHDHDHH